MKRDELIRLLQSMPENVEVVFSHEDFLHPVRSVKETLGTQWSERYYAESFYPEVEDEPVHKLIELSLSDPKSK